MSTTGGATGSAVIPGDIVGEWKIHLPDGIHTVELEHGTTTGKRVIRVDGNEVRTDVTFSITMRPANEAA